MGRLIAPLLVAFGVAGAWILVLPPAPVAQPLAFNHAAHRPMACVTCHRGAATSRQAGIPEGDVCLKCHVTAPLVARANAVWPRLAKERLIDWVQITRLPDHVTFSHRRHVVVGGLDCGSCHGDTSTRTIPLGVAPIRLDMAACLSCHRHEGAGEDCAGCHR